MSGNTEVIQENIGQTNNRLETSRERTNTSSDRLGTTHLRQTVVKWAPMGETAAARSKTESVTQGLLNAVEAITAAIEEFKKNVEQTRDDFDNTDETGRANFHTRFDSIGQGNLDRYSGDVNGYDAVNRFNRNVLPNLPVPFARIDMSPVVPEGGHGNSTSPTPSGKPPASSNSSNSDVPTF